MALTVVREEVSLFCFYRGGRGLSTFMQREVYTRINTYLFLGPIVRIIQA
jgi:hypothetical protein